MSTVPDLKKAMIWNPNLKVFVASGIYDLATPYFATDYTFSHLGLSKNLQKNIQIHKYEGGHMMYTNVKALKRLKADLVKFY